MNYPTNTAMLIDIMNKYGKHSKEYDTFKKHSLIYGHKTKILYKIYQSILEKALTNQ
jgi:hypothetical protein